MRRPFLSALAALFIPAASMAQQAGPVSLHDLSDLSIYVKPRFTSPNTWDQQLGLRARLLRDGNFSAEFSIAYDPVYPIRFNIEPKWTSGVQLAYFFTRAPFPIAAYTTPKYNLVNGWKEEVGLNARIVSTPRFYVNSSVDYQASFPYVRHSKPAFQVSLTLGFPLATR